MSELDAWQIETLKDRFRDAGCTVTDLQGSTFQIVGKEFPLMTHVTVNPYFVELATFLFASSKGFLPGKLSKLHEYLSDINRDAKIVKFTLERESPPVPKGVWPIYASLKYVTGEAGGEYTAEALKNLLLLWYQDIAALIASPGGWELHPMMREEDSKKD